MDKITEKWAEYGKLQALREQLDNEITQTTQQMRQIQVDIARLKMEKAKADDEAAKQKAKVDKEVAAKKAKDAASRDDNSKVGAKAETTKKVLHKEAKDEQGKSNN